MDKSAAHDWAVAHLNDYTEPLNLNDWAIRVEVCASLENSDGDVLAGVCHALPLYERAIIQLSSESADDERSLADTLRHELLHVVLSDAETLWTAIEAAVEEGPLRDVLHNAHVAACERQVLKLEYVFNRLAAKHDIFTPPAKKPRKPRKPRGSNASTHN